MLKYKLFKKLLLNTDIYYSFMLLSSVYNPSVEGSLIANLLTLLK